PPSRGRGADGAGAARATSGSTRLLECPAAGRTPLARRRSVRPHRAPQPSSASVSLPTSRCLALPHVRAPARTVSLRKLAEIGPSGWLVPVRTRASTSRQREDSICRPHRACRDRGGKESSDLRDFDRPMYAPPAYALVKRAGSNEAP